MCCSTKGINIWCNFQVNLGMNTWPLNLKTYCKKQTNIETNRLWLETDYKHKSFELFEQSNVIDFCNFNRIPHSVECKNNLVSNAICVLKLSNLTYVVCTVTHSQTWMKQKVSNSWKFPLIKFIHLFSSIIMSTHFSIQCHFWKLLTKSFEDSDNFATI